MLKPEELAAFKRGARRRWQEEQHALTQRRERAWQLARSAAQLLKEQFGATRVVVFGSLTHEGRFTPWSDVDIAAWGLKKEDTFRAIGAVMDLDNQIALNLVDVNTCRPEIVAVIEREGVKL